MSQEQLFLSLLTLTVGACVKHTLPTQDELQDFHNFLLKSHAVHGVHPSFHDSSLIQWVNKLTPSSQETPLLILSRKRPANSDSTSSSSNLSSPSSSLMALMLDAMQTEEAPIVNTNHITTELSCPPNDLVLSHEYHRRTGHLTYLVQWSNKPHHTLASYSELQGLNCLVEYESQMLVLRNSLHGHPGFRYLKEKRRKATAKYIRQRDKEEAAMKDNMDSDNDELGQESQLALERSLLAPSIDSLQTSSGGWLRMLAGDDNSGEEDCSTVRKKAPRCTLEMELPLDMAGTMMTKTSSMISSDWESSG